MMRQSWRGVSMCLSLIVLLPACDGQPRRSSTSEGASAKVNPGGSRGPAPAASDRRDHEPITWTTKLGPGGAEVPPWPLLPAPAEATRGFSRLLGVVLSPEQSELLFVGVQDDTRPRVVVDDLMDALVVSLRAVPDAPGVSIDPTAAQLTHGLKAHDEMRVRYIGGDERSIVGAVAFEADRMMKCLSFAKDNISSKPVTCAVPGYQSELDASLEEPATARREWHRFWIEQMEIPVDVSDDGRTMLLGARLGIQTEYMEVVDGALRSGRRAPTGSAKRFADHLTNNYDGYGREFPVYDQLRGFAQMVNLARALADQAAPAEIDAVRTALDVDALMSRRVVRAVDTALTTPAIVATKQASSGNVIRTVALTGGVDLTPHVKYQTRSDAANALQREVTRAVAEHPGRASWTVQRGSETLVAIRRNLAPSTTKIWQTDMTVGPLHFARVSQGNEQGLIGRYWKPMLPELQFSAETVQVERLGTMPRSVLVSTGDGELLSLGQHATVQMPGQPPTPGFVGTPGRRRKKRTLYRYSNGIVLVDGDVRYVSDNNGPPRPEIPSEASIIDFSPESPYRPQRIQTSEGTINVLWAGSRLLGYRADSGERIELRYDQAGRVVGLSGSDGQVVDYRFDSLGRLRAAVNAQGDSLAYRLPDGDGNATGIWAEFPNSSSSANVTYGRFERSHGVPPETLRQQTAALSNAATVFIGLFERPAGSGAESDSVVAGQSVETNVDLERLVEGVLLNEKGTGPQSTLLRQMFLDAAPSRGRSNIVIVGDAYKRDRLALALAEIDPNRSISTAANPQLAARNLAALPRARSGVQYVNVVEGLDPGISDTIERLAAKHRRPGDLLIVVGHNSTEFQAKVQLLASSGQLQGKTVLLVTCGSESGGEFDGLFQAGATQVIAPYQPIDQRLLEPFLTAIDRRLEATQKPPATVIRTIVDDVIKDPRVWQGLNLTDDDVRGLRMQVRQVGRLEGLTRPPDSPGL